MKDRLEKFMKTEGLSPSRFAEIMDVNSSNISHLLNGRNNPSLDFVNKMLLRFPKVNPDWLILGKGPIYRPQGNETNTSPQNTSTINQVYLPTQRVTPAPGLFDSSAAEHKSLFTANEAATVNQQNVRHEEGGNGAEALFLEQTPQSESTTDRIQRESVQGKIPKNQLISALHEAVEDDIERIVIFFKDKTFISYQRK